MTRGLQRVFSEVAPSYDLVNHILTLGWDIVWRRKAARLAAGFGGTAWLDVCSGPGEMARRLAALAPSGTLVAAADFTPAMVAASRTRGRVRFVISEAGELPFPGGCFDLVTISFATRNINTGREPLLARFREFRRVLKPGGLFLNLETSQPPRPLIRKAFHAYIQTVVKPVGLLLSGSRSGYSYLASTIPLFFSAERLSELILEAGFRSADPLPLLFGAAAIHLAIK